MTLQKRLPGWILSLLICAQSPYLWAQTGANGTAQTAPARLRIFLDCPGMCDQDYLRQNIEFIDYVRERTVADVHVLVTLQGTGGGGIEWTVKFIGLGFFDKQDRTITFTTPQTATGDDRRKEFARIFKIGLVGYAAGTSVAPQLDVTWRRPATALGSSANVTADPWHYWVFRIGANGNMNGEASSNNRSIRFNFNGSRTTQKWKINIGGNSNSNLSRFKVSDSDTITSRSNGWNFNTLVVKSITPKWSYGARANVSHSSFSNTDRQISFSPAIEYDIFPYSESSRRSLTIQYSAGVSKYDYRELTVYDKLRETVPNHGVNTSLGIRAPWGNVSASTTFVQHLNHTDRYHVSIFGQTDIRLFKGFSFNIFGEYDRIRDQIALRKGAASTEEVLLRVQQLATGFSYFSSFGISYSFGSIFNSTVNPRFNNGGF